MGRNHFRRRRMAGAHNVHPAPQHVRREGGCFQKRSIASRRAVGVGMVPGRVELADQRGKAQRSRRKGPSTETPLSISSIRRTMPHPAQRQSPRQTPPHPPGATTQPPRARHKPADHPAEEKGVHPGAPARRADDGRTCSPQHRTPCRHPRQYPPPQSAEPRGCATTYGPAGLRKPNARRKHRISENLVTMEFPTMGHKKRARQIKHYVSFQSKLIQTPGRSPSKADKARGLCPSRRRRAIHWRPSGPTTPSKGSPLAGIQGAEPRALLAYRTASPRRNSWVRSSSFCLRAGSSFRSTAARVSVSWSGRLAPMMGAVTTGLARAQAMAAVVREWPAPVTSLRSSSTLLNSRACQ